MWYSVQIFEEQNFRGLASCICGSHMHNFCHCSQLQLLTSTSKFFAQGRTSSRASLVCSLELINYTSQAQDASPLINTMDVKGTYESAPKDLEAFVSGKPCCS